MTALKAGDAEDTSSWTRGTQKDRIMGNVFFFVFVFVFNFVSLEISQMRGHCDIGLCAAYLHWDCSDRECVWREVYEVKG